MLHAITVLVCQVLAVSEPSVSNLPDRNIRIEHLVADQKSIDPAIRRLVVARMPDGARQIEIDAETARRLIDSRIPGAWFPLAFEDRITFTVTEDTNRQPVCFAASRDIAKDAIISRGHVVEVPCGGRRTHRDVAYDRESAAPIAAQAISAGNILGPIRPAAAGLLRKSEDLTLVTGGTGVTIRRAVKTLQPGREGKMVFVTTADGEVFAVPFDNLGKD